MYEIVVQSEEALPEATRNSREDRDHVRGTGRCQEKLSGAAGEKGRETEGNYGGKTEAQRKTTDAADTQRREIAPLND